MSGILLSVLSPVWQAKLCRGLDKASRSRLDLTLDDAASFATAVELGCGRSTAVRGGLAGLLSVGRLADAYGIEHVHRAVEWEATRRLTVDTCAELLAGSSVAGMPRLTRTCRELALGEFDALCRTEGFVLLEEEELGALLDADAVAGGREEAALSAVLRWMRPAGAGEPRGKSLVTMPSFKRLCKASRRGTGTMGEDVPMVEGLRELLGEAAAAATAGEGGPAGSTSVAGPLDPAGQGAEGTPGDAADMAREPCHSQLPTAAARRWWYGHGGTPRPVLKCNCWSCEGKCVALSRELAVCAGFGRNGEFCAVLRDDLSDQALDKCSTTSQVVSVAMWRDWIVVGHSSGEIEIWESAQRGKAGSGRLTNGPGSLGSDTLPLQCIGALDDGSASPSDCSVTGLGVTGGVPSRLVSECGGVLKVWAAGSTARTWTCERTIQFQQKLYRLLAVWGTSAAAGHYDNTIRVWDLDSGACQATLSGHTQLVCSLAVHADGRVLASASNDRTLRVWEVETESCLRKLDVDMDVRCVAVSEGKIFGGLSSVVRRGAAQTPAVHVWDLHTLEQEGTLWMQDRPVGSKVELKRIIVDGSEVWAHMTDDVGGTVLVWGWTTSKMLVRVFLVSVSSV